MALTGDLETASNLASQFDKQSAFSQWRKWAILMGGVCGVLLITFLLGNPTLTAIGIYGVITALFAITIYQNYTDVRFLDREKRLASTQVELMAECNDVAAFLDQAEPSMFRSHIERLYTVFLAHPSMEQDNLIEILHSRLMARNRVVELFASILITLGLIGTIVGLIQTIGGLSGLLANSSGEEGSDLAQQMMQSLGGLDTAFYTTLLGAVCGGVVLRILTSVVDANIMRYTAHIAELTEVNVLPAMRRIANRLDRSGYYDRLDTADPPDAPA
ncbi:MAG: MotA/TolQ/ExbB proton channel family protein [Planctomycetota bacterium]